ncbi:putative hydrogenase nickel incorporation protein HypA [Sporomusaceae bacterium FL31]|nr:putative hydrogenase nickel incorporation protein HypA [Sporomusaceae bacterium FL31]GCE34585.1 putative hydrogenase nickel incorporation protein HypA [Sporomusaceae bacterium]
MHEMAIAQSILDIVLQTAADHGATRVNTIKLLIGEMTQIVPQSLEFGFTTLAAGTIAQHASLQIKIVPAQGKCNQCGYQFHIQCFMFSCPDCHSISIEILSGRELLVDALEVE